MESDADEGLRKRTAWGLSAFYLAVLVVHVFVPSGQIDAVGLALVVLVSLPWLLPHLRSLKLPGGIEIHLRDVKRAAEPVVDLVRKEVAVTSSGYVATPAEAGAREETRESMAALRDVAGSSPGLALVGFRIELEKRIRELAERRGIASSGRQPLTSVAKAISAAGVLSSDVTSGLVKLIRLGNHAAHGVAVDREAADWMLDAGVEILTSIDAAIHREQG